MVLSEGLEPSLRGPKPRVLPIRRQEYGASAESRTLICGVRTRYSTIELRKHGTEPGIRTPTLPRIRRLH